MPEGSDSFSRKFVKSIRRLVSGGKMTIDDSKRFEEVVEDEGPESTLHWRGFDALKYLVILSPTPTKATDKNPLGVKWPGVTYAEPDEPNWVGYLVSPMNAKKKNIKLHVYDYAIGGETVQGVSEQVRMRFMRGLGLKPDYAPWKRDDTLFVFWVGINDCAYIDEESMPAALADLMSSASTVYNAGGRNFLFIDVPPIERSPAIAGRNISPVLLASLKTKYATWNKCLGRAMDAFETSHPYASMFEFSSFDTFTRLLDDPKKYGMNPLDRAKSGGEVWVDHLHPSSAVHLLLATEIEAFLKEQLQNVHPGTPPLQPEPDVSAEAKGSGFIPEP